MMRIVLDANVLAPAFLGTTSNSVRLINLWRRGVYELVVSEHLINELVRAYNDPYFRRRITPPEVASIEVLLRRRALLTPLTVSVIGVATQPKDDLVISTALSAGASHLATRDRQLLKIGNYQGLHIVPPGKLLALFEDGDEESEN